MDHMSHNKTSWPTIWLQLLNKHCQVDMAILDLCKAFGKVRCHPEGVIQDYSISGPLTRWIETLLSDWMQVKAGCGWWQIIRLRTCAVSHPARICTASFAAFAFCQQHYKWDLFLFICLQMIAWFTKTSTRRRTVKLQENLNKLVGTKSNLSDT